MTKQRWGLDRNVLRPTPGDPWGVEQHHWNTGAKENQQLNPGGPSNRQTKRIQHGFWRKRFVDVAFVSWCFLICVFFLSVQCKLWSMTNAQQMYVIVNRPSSSPLLYYNKESEINTMAEMRLIHNPKMYKYFMHRNPAILLLYCKNQAADKF